MSWDEDRLHRWLARLPAPRGLAGASGHDAAVLRALHGLPVVCVDTCTEGVHFARGTSGARAGAKAALRALSDLAATAARPRAVLLGLSAPAAESEARLRAVIRGVRTAARSVGADLVGGDLAQHAGPLCLSVSALGEYVLRGRPPARSRARAGDLVLVTGALGGSLLGRHLVPVPRLFAGELLARGGARALMDVSDGLAWDLFRLARSAGVAIELDLASVPVHADARRRARTSGRTPLWHALHDGEDHELVACLSARDWRRAERGARRAIPGVRVIGRVQRGSGLALRDAHGHARRWRPGEGGWRHGGH